jgi:thiamine biosynthesis lipoprotein ApbE
VVTVVASCGMEADALAKVVAVLGPARGLALVEEVPGARARVVRAPEARVEEHESTRWKEFREKR